MTGEPLGGLKDSPTMKRNVSRYYQGFCDQASTQQNEYPKTTAQSFIRKGKTDTCFQVPNAAPFSKCLATN